MSYDQRSEMWHVLSEQHISCVTDRHGTVESLVNILFLESFIQYVLCSFVPRNYFFQFK